MQDDFLNRGLPISFRSVEGHNNALDKHIIDQRLQKGERCVTLQRPEGRQRPRVVFQDLTRFVHHHQRHWNAGEQGREAL